MGESTENRGSYNVASPAEKPTVIPYRGEGLYTLYMTPNVNSGVQAEIAIPADTTYGVVNAWTITVTEDKDNGTLVESGLPEIDGHDYRGTSMTVRTGAEHGGDGAAPSVTDTVTIDGKGYPAAELKADGAAVTLERRGDAVMFSNEYAYEEPGPDPNPGPGPDPINPGTDPGGGNPDGYNPTVDMGDPEVPLAELPGLPRLIGHSSSSRNRAISSMAAAAFLMGNI